MGLFGLMAITTACVEESEEATTEEEASESENAEAEENISSDEENEESTGEIVENDGEAQPGEVVETEGGMYEIISRTDDVGTFESGPIVMDIEKIVGTSATLTEEAA